MALPSEVRAGVGVRPGRSCAVLLVDDAVVPVADTPGLDVDDELNALLAAVPAGRTLSTVTLDLSPLVLAAVVAAAPEIDRVAVIRIVPRAASDPSLARSPSVYVEQVIRARYTVPGGHDLLGSELCPLDQRVLAEVCAELAATGVRHVAIVAAGSQARPQHERTVADAIEAAIPGARISAAHDFGGQGLVAREATVVLDCALGTLTDTVLGRWERAIASRGQHIALRVARGDGGYSTPSRTRALPSVTLGATDALELCGVAFLAGQPDCRVLLPRPTGQLAGDVRQYLPVVRSAELAAIGTELVVPTAVLAPDPGGLDGGARRRVSDVQVLVAQDEPGLLACVGAAISRPTAWLDEVAFIESSAVLERVRRDAAERATAIVMANGAAPGTAQVTELSTVAVPYSPSGTVRIRVRVAGSAELPVRQVDSPGSPG